VSTSSLNLLYDLRVKACVTVQDVKDVLPDVLADVRTWVRLASQFRRHSCCAPMR
jgi:hypothetical protein